MRNTVRQTEQNINYENSHDLQGKSKKFQKGIAVLC
jgi:hypothetical protein